MPRDKTQEPREPPNFWKQRRIKGETDISFCLHLLSQCRGYRVTTATSKLDGTTTFVACVRVQRATGDGWDVLSNHKRHGAALRACEQHAKEKRR